MQKKQCIERKRDSMETLKIRCIKCGTKNPIDAIHCRNSSCGANVMLFGDVVNTDDSDRLDRDESRHAEINEHINAARSDSPMTEPGLVYYRCTRCGMTAPALESKCRRCHADQQVYARMLSFGQAPTSGRFDMYGEPFFICVKCGTHSYKDQCDCCKCGADLRLYGAWNSMPEAEGLSYQAVKEQKKAGLRVTLTDIDWERYKEKMPDEQTPDKSEQ